MQLKNLNSKLKDLSTGHPMQHTSAIFTNTGVVIEEALDWTVGMAINHFLMEQPRRKPDDFSEPDFNDVIKRGSIAEVILNAMEEKVYAKITMEQFGTIQNRVKASWNRSDMLKFQVHKYLVDQETQYNPKREPGKNDDAGQNEK